MGMFMKWKYIGWWVVGGALLLGGCCTSDVDPVVRTLRISLAPTTVQQTVQIQEGQVINPVITSARRAYVGFLTADGNPLWGLADTTLPTGLYLDISASGSGPEFCRRGCVDTLLLTWTDGTIDTLTYAYIIREAQDRCGSPQVQFDAACFRQDRRTNFNALDSCTSQVTRPNFGSWFEVSF
jgi:hypothetical protein